MNILVGVPDLFVLAGNVRVSLDMAEIFKQLGHEVKILHSDIREEENQYFSFHEIKDYYPIKTLKPSDFDGVRWDNYYMEVLARLGLYEDEPQYDLLFTNFESLAYINEDTGRREVFYVNWPDRPRAPSCDVWVNSEYTGQRVTQKWGVTPKVVNPPIRPEMYDPNPTFFQRDIDVIGFGQLYFQKRYKALTPLYERGHETCVIGADVKQDRPNVSKVVRNPTFREYTRLLSRSKVFIHPKIGEHFGIAIVEAMASGCAAVCHRSGGPLTDIILPDERYGLLFSTEEELVEKVERLLANEDEWSRYSQLAVERAKNFSFDKIKSRVGELIGFSTLDREMVKALISDFSKEGEWVLNPFLSWGVVALAARSLNRHSISFDVVNEYCEEARVKIREVETSSPKDIKTVVHCCDSRNMPLGDNSVDLILGSPPYWHRERYKSVPRQLSDIPNYDAFLSELDGVVSECFRVLKPGRYCLWVLGDWIEEGRTYYFHRDVMELFKKNGFVLDAAKRSVTDRFTVKGAEGTYERVVAPFMKG